MEHLGDRVYAYLAGALPEAEEAAVAAHLRECPECRQRTQAARSVVTAFKRLPAAPREECPNIAALLGLARGSTTRSQSEELEKHVFRCRPCTETRARLATRAEKGALDPTGKAQEFLADVLRDLTAAGVTSERFLSGMNGQDFSFAGEVRLGLLAPAQAKRLAADTGAAFEACQLTSEDGGVEARVEQFGRLLRVKLTLAGEACREGLALVMFEEGEARMSLPLAIRRGEGFGTLSSDAPGFRKPSQKPYGLRMTFVPADEIVKALVSYGVL